MLGDAEYERKWKLKLAWYAENGILPHDKGGGPNGMLVTSWEIGGIDNGQIAGLIKIIKSGG